MMNSHNEVGIFDMLKVSIGPSSSHTMGPWIAAQSFIHNMIYAVDVHSISYIEVDLTGSLAKTGKGHSTDMGIVMGLMNESANTIDPHSIAKKMSAVMKHKYIAIQKEGVVHHIAFDPSINILFSKDVFLPYHPNGVIFKAFGEGEVIFSETYYSIGGGFIEKDANAGVGHTIADNTKNSSDEQHKTSVPYPIENGAQLLQYCEETGKNIDEIAFANERCAKSEDEIDAYIVLMKNTMMESIYDACNTEGVLPGGLHVRRRAYDMYRRLALRAGTHLTDDKYSQCQDEKTKKTRVATWFDDIAHSPNFVDTIDWVICFALAVNETNASSGRIVTAPTNGSAGVIPAVLAYYVYLSAEDKGFEDVKKFLLTASVVGALFKKNATISAAAGGCQAEIGVSSVMAAAGLTAVRGGDPQRILMAAEISMEHHLGLTCDPIGGLVQIPCIERNSMGAVKAITASQIALSSSPEYAKVSIDEVIQTMWETALDMNSKYKETADGGLATNVKGEVKIPVIFPEC